MPNSGPIYIDASVLASKHLTGLARYTARLALAFAKRGDLRFFEGGRRIVPSARLDWSEDQDLADWAKRVWRGRRGPLAPEPDSVGIYPCMRTSRRLFPTEVSILHDLTPLMLSETHTARTVAEFREYYAKGLPASDVAVADSNSTRADAAWLCDFPEDRVFVGHPGASLCVGRHLDARPARRRPEVGIVVATIEPRKNADFLIDWFRNTSVLPPGAELWWVGARGWLSSRRANGIKGRDGRRLRFLGVVDDRSLCRLYRTAGWMAYPSLYEGFGFPVLDALRHGVPVLAAGNSSLREFAGPGVGFFDPLSAETLDAAFLRMGRGDYGPPPTVAELDAKFDWGVLADTIRNAAATAVGTSVGERRVA